MGLKVYTTRSASELTGAEVSLLAGAVREHGRATLLVPTLSERDLCRRALADAGAGTGIDVATPSSWIAGMWELLGDGRRIATSIERRGLVVGSGNGILWRHCGRYQEFSWHSFPFNGFR